MREGDAIPELKVTPDKYLPHRYAGASGDFNPIHIDREFARRSGCRGNILHGLWGMAQVARAVTAAAGGDPRALRRLAVQFRGMGFPEQEITVTGTVRSARRRRDRRRRRAERQGDHPQRRGRDNLKRSAARFWRPTVALRPPDLVHGTAAPPRRASLAHDLKTDLPATSR